MSTSVSLCRRYVVDGQWPCKATCVANVMFLRSTTELLQRLCVHSVGSWGAPGGRGKPTRGFPKASQRPPQALRGPKAIFNGVAPLWREPLVLKKRFPPQWGAPPLKMAWGPRGSLGEASGKPRGSLGDASGNLREVPNMSGTQIQNVSPKMDQHSLKDTSVNGSIICKPMPMPKPVFVFFGLGSQFANMWLW